ncbi:ROK family protein (plasmid) [Rhizobium lusitanum]|uniref:ROK family protein n=1 Tax=Rhizobium lusitanum TaxID=293958 RepID=UPI001610EFEA|nr:ROK family protein [Rhizobium lusitanum]QND46797.1 ROK family protein [Rhizobium lusitanum]
MAAKPKSPKPTTPTAPKDLVVLAIDLGGSHVKMLLSSGSDRRTAISGAAMSAQKMVETVKELTADWQYDVIGMGYPGPVTDNKPAAEPHNLGPGWKDFDFSAAFGKPVKLVNDAVMQAIGSYKDGNMLFLGLGTGLGSAMIVNHVCLPMELAHLPYKKDGTFEDFVGERGLEKYGKKKWRKSVEKVVGKLQAALLPHEIVIGGGNVEKLENLPNGCRAGDNENAFLGGFRLWKDESLRF